MVEAASSYPLLDVFWTMVVFFAWMIWIWLLVMTFADLFGRQDISGWGKAGWTAVVLVLPYFGVFAYLISQSHGMAERKSAQVREQQASFDSYVKSVASTPSGGAAAAQEIGQAKELLDSGAITPAEYEALKQKALST
ncbi:MAG: SHOCT domain-containing protein [Mycobacteriales bacterium]